LTRQAGRGAAAGQAAGLVGLAAIRSGGVLPLVGSGGWRSVRGVVRIGTKKKPRRLGRGCKKNVVTEIITHFLQPLQK